jgi:hypothetical protein
LPTSVRYSTIGHARGAPIGQAESAAGADFSRFVNSLFKAET